MPQRCCLRDPAGEEGEEGCKEGGEGKKCDGIGSEGKEGVG